MFINIGRLRNTLLCGISLLTGTLFVTPAGAQQQELQGRYFNVRRSLLGKNVLSYEEVNIHKSKDGGYLFSLSRTWGLPIPSTRQIIYSRLAWNRASGHYESVVTDAAQGCKVELFRQNDSLTVKALTDSCVYATSTLVLMDAANPGCFTYDYLEGDNYVTQKNYFSTTPPESFHPYLAR